MKSVDLTQRSDNLLLKNILLRFGDYCKKSINAGETDKQIATIFALNLNKKKFTTELAPRIRKQISLIDT